MESNEYLYKADLRKSLTELVHDGKIASESIEKNVPLGQAVAKELEIQVPLAQQVKQETEQLIQSGGAATKAQVDQIVKDFDEVVANVTNGNESATNTEIVLARKGETSLKAKIDKIDTSLDYKANKNEVFSMANMGQDVKEAMTGGSVAVVGKDAVLTENIVDSQITPIKTNFLTTNENILNLADVIDGKYFIGYKPWIKDDVSKCCIKIPVVKGMGYSSTDIFTNFTLFEKADGTRTNAMATTNQIDRLVNFVPIEDGFLCLSIEISKKNKSMLVNAPILPANFVEYNKSYEINLKGLNLKDFENCLVDIKQTTDSIIPICNLVSQTEILIDKYFIDYRPWIKDGVGYACVKVPVHKGQSYSSSEVHTAFTLFENSSGKRTKLMDSAKQLDNIIGYTPSEDGFLCLSFQSTLYSEFMLVNSMYVPMKYYEFNKPYAYILGETDTNKLFKNYDSKNDLYYDLKTIVVAKDGSGDFTHIVDAYNSITNNSATNRHKIVVKQGIYDFGEKYNSVTATNYVGIVLNKHYVYFEGENAENTILYFDGCPSDISQITNEQAYRVALFHWGVKNTFKGHIKRFTLRATNCRYTLHPETASQGNGGDWLIENCIFDFLGNPKVASWNGCTVGVGVSCGEKGHFKNCKWVSANGEALCGHNGGFDYATKPFIIPNCQLTFENCDFGGNNVRIDSYVNESGFHDVFKLLSCKGIKKGFFGLQGNNTEKVWKCIKEATKIEIDEFDY